MVKDVCEDSCKDDIGLGPTLQPVGRGAVRTLSPLTVPAVSFSLHPCGRGVRMGSGRELWLGLGVRVGVGFAHRFVSFFVSFSAHPPGVVRMRVVARARGEGSG